MALVKRSRGGVQPVALTRSDVIEEGLRIVQREGLDALTITTVARDLGVSSPAVYYYVSGKDDLIDRVCELAAGQISLPPDEGAEWDDRIVAIILEMNDTFARYPGVAARVLPFQRPSRAVDRVADEVRHCIEHGGFTGRDADDLHAALHFLVGGWLLGKRPTVSEGAMTPALLERSVRWLLAGASA